MTERDAITKTAVLFVLGGVISWWSVTAFVGALTMPEETEVKPVTTAQVAGSLGLQPGKAYPLELGSRFSGSAGHMEIRGSWYYIRDEGDWNPATGLSIGFESDENSYILEIPTSRVKFVKSDDAKPSVSVSFASARMDGDLAYESVTYTIETDRHWGWIRHQKVVEESHIVTSPRLTLSTVIEIAMRDPDSSAVITLPSEAYDKLLGG